MLRHRCLLLAKDPFKALGLSRTVSKAEVKAKYRELAKKLHPDKPGGDVKQMEEVNLAYNMLMKEGAYERFHLAPGAAGSAGISGSTTGGSKRPQRKSASAAGVDGADGDGEEEEYFLRRKDGPSGLNESNRRRTSPFSAEGVHIERAPTGFGAGAKQSDSHFEEEAGGVEEEEVDYSVLSGLDADTERVTPEGKFLYQNKDTGDWVQLSRPLMRAKQQPRYSSYSQFKQGSSTFTQQQAASQALWEEVERQTVSKDAKDRSRSRFERYMNRLEEGGFLPSRNKAFVAALSFLMVVLYYRNFRHIKPLEKKTDARETFYVRQLEERRIIEEEYMASCDKFNISVNAAAIIFLAAALKKDLEDPVVAPFGDEFTYSVPKFLFRILAMY